MEALNTYKTEKTLAEQMNERLAEMKMTKAEAALKMNYSRAALSQYLNGKYASDPTELEKKVREFLAATGGVAEGQEPENSVPTGAGTLKKKVEFFESRDFVQTIGVCQACQEYMGLGIIVGKSGQGKTHALKKYAELPRVAWKLPDLKLPHISVNGGQAPYGIGGKGSLPSFSIQWYKEGGILNGATIFGAMGGNLLGGGEAGAEAVLPLSELWKQMTEIVKGVVKGENEESGDTVQQTGANITSALTSKAASVRKEKESKTTTTKETYTSERWGKEGGTTIHQISFTVDISKIKDLPLLYKLIDELKDAQNRTDSPTPATT